MLFVNKPKFFDKAYRRYLNNQFQTLLGFDEVPLRFVFKERRSFFDAPPDHGDDDGDAAPYARRPRKGRAH